MTFREKTTTTILLLVARILCEDEETAAAIKTLATHIGVHGKVAFDE